MDSHGLPWTPMDSHGLPWTPMDSHGLPWTPMDSHGLPWQRMELFDGYLPCGAGRSLGKELKIKNPMGNIK